MKYFLRLTLLVVPLTAVWIIFMAPTDPRLGETTRLLYIHVPWAWTSVLAFIYSGILSVMYFFKTPAKRWIITFKARNSIALGLLFTLFTIVSGSLWAKATWGSYWNQDPRETSIVILLLIYISYLALYSSLRDHSKQGSICAAYLIIATAVMPFLVFVIPRIYPSLHPALENKENFHLSLDYSMRIVLYSSLIAQSMFFASLLWITNRYSNVKNKITSEKQ